jgi:hypothetical protein
MSTRYLLVLLVISIATCALLESPAAQPLLLAAARVGGEGR